MDLRAIAIRIAHTSSDEHVGYSENVLKVVDDAMRFAMGVSPSAKPMKSGISSAVFENQRGNIIVFTFDPNAAEVANSIKGELKEILPEIYEVQEWKKEEGAKEEWKIPRTGIPTDTIYAIEMEKLRLLDEDEAMVWAAWIDDFEYGQDDPDKFEQMELDTFAHKVETDPMAADYVGFVIDEQKKHWDDLDWESYDQTRDYMLREMQDLAAKAYILNIRHSDAHPYNIAWGKDGDLKFIDLEDVKLENVDLAPQSVPEPLGWSGMSSHGYRS